MESLNEIGITEDTDKAELALRGSHHYANLYELLFRNWRNNPISILEIGVLAGGSIRMWRKYFPKSQVTAIDVSDQIKFADSNIEFIHGDAYSEEVLSKLSGRSFDIMIDDADHQPPSQQAFLKLYAPLLKPDGILIIEDVFTRDGALALKRALPSGFCSATVDMAEGNSIIDSRLFIVYRHP